MKLLAMLVSRSIVSEYHPETVKKNAIRKYIPYVGYGR